MTEFLMQITLYHDGSIRYEGRQLAPGDLGYVLRQIADAADAGKITWGDNARSQEEWLTGEQSR